MTKRKRILLSIAGLLLLVIATLSFYANSIVKAKIEAMIKDKMPAHIEASYKNINVHILGGSVSIEEPTVLIKVKDSTIVHTKVAMKSLLVGNFSYWDYFMNNELHIGKLEFKEIATVHFKNLVSKTKDSTKTGDLTNFKESIKIDKINLKSKSSIIYDGTEDSTLVSIKNSSVLLKNILIDSTSISNTIPFNYEKVKIEADSVFYKAGEYENIHLDKLLLEDKTLSLGGFQYKTKYNKEEYSRVLAIERDHFNVQVEDLKVNDIAFGLSENDSLFFKTSLISVNNANAAIYRDKLVADDLKTKKLYSRSIRELPLKLTIDSITIKNSQVKYSEKAHPKNPAGVITIKDINAQIKNISNTYSTPEKTEIIVDGIFMKETPISANWSFDTNDPSDRFKFEGRAGNLELADMNDFLTPLLNVEIIGEVRESIFVINGNYTESTINLSQDYNHIDLTILDKKKGKNKVLSTVANVFINKNSRNKDSRFHSATAQTKRDGTKSFFNYLAKNLKNGLLINFTSKNNKIEKRKTKSNKKSKKK